MLRIWEHTPRAYTFVMVIDALAETPLAARINLGATALPLLGPAALVLPAPLVMGDPAGVAAAP